MTAVSTDQIDPRLLPPPDQPPAAPLWRARLMVVVGAAAAALYLSWLLRPARIGFLPLFVLLVIAELFNVTQALGFWWTCARRRRRSDPGLPPAGATVDVFIPVYNEPVDVVEPTVAAARRLRGAEVRVALLDDGDSPEMEAMARRHGIGYLRRTVHSGAKAGNINHALGRTDADFVAVFDCDHVPSSEFLMRTLGYFTDASLAFVQTPQYYANGDDSPMAAAAWSQQALFFGPIAEGKDAHGAMFCCGTNVVFRRTALEEVGGFPEVSLTEDFELSLELHERGWSTVYVPEILASGLGPEDMASYVSQQHRWARGCLSAIPRVVRSQLPVRLKLHYLLSSMFFLSGWTFAVYMMLPVVRILTGAQPVAGASADQFLLVFGPYFGLALLTLAVLGGGRYRFDAYSLAFASFWIHIHASIKTVFRRPGRFVVTPKHGTSGHQPKAVLPALIAATVLVGAAAWGLAAGRSPATLNNVAFAALHVTVLASGARHAIGRAAAVEDTVALTADHHAAA
ncbi:MAG: glycosyltransferase [Acidimicrobiales bacterium]